MPNSIDSKAEKRKTTNLNQVLSVDVGELSRLEIVDDISSPRTTSTTASPASRSSQSLSLSSPINVDEDEEVGRCFVNLVRIELHFNATRKRRSSFRRSTRNKSFNRSAKQTKAPLSFVLKDVPNRAHAMEIVKSGLSNNVRRFSKADHNHAWLDDESEFEERRRIQLFDAIWWKSHEFLEREIYFFKLIYKHELFTKKAGEVLPSFVPRVFFKLFADGREDAADSFLFIEHIGDNVDRGDAIVGLSKAQVDASIVAIAQFHAFTVSHLGVKDIELMQISAPDLRKEKLLKSWIELKLRKLSIFAEREDEIRQFVYSTHFFHIDAHKSYGISGISPVLSHGDYHASNIFFDKTPRQNVKAILDWKFAYASTGLNDVLRLLLTSVNSSLRLKHTDEWLTLYTTAFNLALHSKHGGRHDRAPYRTLSTVRKMFEQEYASQLLYALAYLADLYENVEGSEYYGKDDDGNDEDGGDGDDGGENNKEGQRTCIMGRIVQAFEATKTFSPNF